MMELEAGRTHLVRVLGATPFFGGLPNQALAALARSGQLRRFAKGSTIYRRGESGISLMLVLEGRIKICNVSPEGHEIVLNFLRAGDLVGEIAVLDGKDRTASAIALAETHALVIMARDLIPTLIAHPQALLEITKTLCDKLRAASAIVEDATLDMRARAARGLLRLAQRHGMASNKAIRLDLAVSQQDLGNYLGISRENVSREFGRLRLANVIRLEEGHIVITDEEGLQEIADYSSDL
jgi:CRP/FNR family transcriptional regulator, cyclic AMP receptor protein